MKLDRKCCLCPVRKFALKSVNVLRLYYELNEKLLETLEDFETGIDTFDKVRQDSLEVLKHNEYC